MSVEIARLFSPIIDFLCVQQMRNSQDHQLNSNQLITNESNERKKMWTKKRYSKFEILL